MREFDKSTILLFIILLVLLASSISIYVNKILTPTLNNNKIIEQYEKDKQNNLSIEEKDLQEEVVEETDEEKLLDLKSMTEVERIKKYFSQYINYVDKKEYDKAYECLYGEFKQKYFGTKEDYEKYIDETYPEYFGIEYSNVTRQGTYYILTVKIYNALDDSVTKYLEQSFVVYETEVGKFYLSFQV